MKIFQYDFPTKIFFGAQSRFRIAKNLKEAGKARPLLITDRDMLALDFISEIKTDLRNAGLRVESFSAVWGNPLESQVKSGVESYKEWACDSAVAVGGGAVLDVAKAVLLMASHPGQLFDYEDGRRDLRSIDPQAMPYFLAVPTTAGTGSEVGRSAVISDNKTKVKKIIFSPSLLPQAVFADPELTLGLPAKVTASTGMDALTHCIEAYLAKGFHPMCDGIALEGMRLISQSLEKCVSFTKESQSLSAREEQLYYRGLMLNAAMMGALAFQKGLGVNHSCAHSLSIVCDLHHGLANAVMLPYTMHFNSEQEEEKFARMSSAIGLQNGAGSKSFLDWLSRLKKKIEIPEKLGEVGVQSQNLDSLVDFAFQDPCHQLNPRKVSKADFRELFERAL